MPDRAGGVPRRPDGRLHACYRSRCALALVLSGVSFVSVQAEVSDSGIELGKWVLAPYVESSFERDSNLLRQSGESEAESIASLATGLTANMPFRESLLQLYGQYQQVSYDQAQFTRDSDWYLGYDLNIAFSSKDYLAIGQSYTEGFTDVGRYNEGGELVFEGVPYKQLASSFSLSRLEPNRAGYLLLASFSETQFTDAENASQFLYDRDGAFLGGEFRYPLPSYRWLVLYYGRSEEEHFFPVTRESFREARAESVQLGVRGVLSRGQPYVIRFGYGSFRYDFPPEVVAVDERRESENPGRVRIDPVVLESVPVESTSNQQLTAHARLRISIGGGSELDLSLDVRQLPSAFDTSFTNIAFRTGFSREWLRRSEFGFRLRFDDNRYADPVPVSGCGAYDPLTDSWDPIERHDFRWAASGFAEWRIHSRFAYAMELSHDRRRSDNCPVLDFDATNLALGITFGW